MRFVARRAKSSLTSSATAAKLAVKNCGNAFHRFTALDIVTATSGKHISRSSLRSSTQPLERKLAARHMSSGGTTRCGNGSRALSGSRYRSRNQSGCTRFVCACFCTATISHCFPPDFSTTPLRIVPSKSDHRRLAQMRTL